MTPADRLYLLRMALRLLWVPAFLVGLVGACVVYAGEPKRLTYTTTAVVKEFRCWDDPRDPQGLGGCHHTWICVTTWEERMCGPDECGEFVDPEVCVHFKCDDRKLSEWCAPAYPREKETP